MYPFDLELATRVRAMTGWRILATVPSAAFLVLAGLAVRNALQRVYNIDTLTPVKMSGETQRTDGRVTENGGGG